ncbi:MAG TPA: hypothetical protein PK373_08140, partial [Sedimentisphaerales bacterium]|nr:hypothetical protein [Sedimentisphaerales bacterium]
MRRMNGQIWALSLLVAVGSNGQIPPKPSIIAVGPYLQYMTRTNVSILWETSEAATSVVEYGEQVPLTNRAFVEGQSEMHEVRLERLKPQSCYFYRVLSKGTSGE